MVTPVVKREVITHLKQGFKVSERRACRVLDIHRSLVRYQSKRFDNNTLRQRLRELSFERKRFGYRRLHILLMREGMQVNHKKLWRIYKEEGLSVRTQRQGQTLSVVGANVALALVDQLFCHQRLMSVGH